MPADRRPVIAPFPEVAATFCEVAIQTTAHMMTDWLCRQGEHGKIEHGKIELEDTQTAVEMLRGMMVMDTQRAVMLGQRAVPDQAEITLRERHCARLFLNGCVVR
jgi:hypothetical protein